MSDKHLTVLYQRPSTKLRFCMLLAVALELAAVMPILAQNQAEPDFSGTWSLSLAKSKLGKHADVHSQIVVITASGLNVVMRFITDGKESMHSYVADGKERVVTDVRVGKTTEKAYWKKSSFITETIGRITSSEVPPVSDEIFRAKDRWTLSPDSQVLIEESDLLGGHIWLNVLPATVHLSPNQ